MKVFKYQIKINSINNQIEKMVIKLINKSPLISYQSIKQKELENIHNQIINQFKLDNFSPQIILSMRSTYMKEHMMYSHKQIISKQKNILYDYDSGMNIKNLVIKYDGSPLNLLRLIFSHKYTKKLKTIIYDKTILNSRDKKELMWALQNDIYALVNQDEILSKSIEFENKIKNILDNQEIKYLTQNDLAQEQLTKYNNISNTPDFLILDELYINGNKINWIDAKNFYGPNTKIHIQKIKSQTHKYINTWGSGAIIYNLSFNSELHIPNIIMIDYESFKKI